jgi:hypothetical protein
VYLPFWVAIPLYAVVGAVWAVILICMTLWWLLVVLPARGITAWQESRSARERAPSRPEAIAARQAEEEEWRRKREDHDARTHRYRVSECRIDALKGGKFTLEAEGLDTVDITVEPDTAMRFLSLKKGDIVQVTHAPGNAGLEEFWHLSRANGAKPRSPADFGPGELLTRRRDEGTSPPVWALPPETPVRPQEQARAAEQPPAEKHRNSRSEQWQAQLAARHASRQAEAPGRAAADQGRDVARRERKAAFRAARGPWQWPEWTLAAAVAAFVAFVVLAAVAAPHPSSAPSAAGAWLLGISILGGLVGVPTVAWRWYRARRAAAATLAGAGQSQASPPGPRP